MNLTRPSSRCAGGGSFLILRSGTSRGSARAGGRSGSAGRRAGTRAPRSGRSGTRIVLPSRRSSATSCSDCFGLTRSSRSPCAISSGARTLLEPVHGRARAVGVARGRRVAHHPLEVLHALAVALRPGGQDVAVAVLRHRAAEAVLRVVGDRQQRHVGAVARAEDRRAARRRPSRACAGGRRRRGSPTRPRRPRRRGWRARTRARSRSSRGSSPPARRSPCRGSTARGRPSCRRTRRSGRRAGRRSPATGRSGEAAAGRKRKAGISSPSRERNVTSSGAARAARGGPRAAPARAACGPRPARRARRSSGGVAWSSYVATTPPAGRPLRAATRRRRRRARSTAPEPASTTARPKRLRTRARDDDAVAVRDATPARRGRRRPSSAAARRSRRGRRRAAPTCPSARRRTRACAPSGDHAGARSCIRGVPLSARTAPVATSATRISERLRSARGVKTYATSERSGETAGAHSSPWSGEPVEPARPRVGDGDDGEPRGVVALDAHEQRRVVDPDRAARVLEQLARRPARGRDEPHVALVGVGDLRAVGREPRRGVLPVRHRRAAGRQAARRPGAARRGRAATRRRSRRPG